MVVRKNLTKLSWLKNSFKIYGDSILCRLCCHNTTRMSLYINVYWKFINVRYIREYNSSNMYLLHLKCQIKVGDKVFGHAFIVFLTMDQF